jgi:DNA-binding NtrC family response regulator
MLPILARAMDARRLRLENIRLRHYVEKLSYESPRYHMIGSGPAMDRVAQLIAKVAPTDATVLICGRSGTGKEIVAHAVHSNSLRRNRPMVTINCAALQENLLESELFGHEKGAFTGAQQSKLGLIEVAEGGTLFIDEVAEMAPSLQAKLLRVLEDGHYRRVGSTKECHADVRIIAATNKPLDQEQRAGRFREDLYFRLNVVTIELPPLCERRQDIPALAEHFLAHRQIGPKPCRLDPKALEALMQYHWPGNIRELANVLERAQILAQDHVITTDDLPETIFVAPLPRSTPSTPSPPPGQSAAPPGASRPAADTTGLDTLNLSDLECRAIQTALLRSKGNKAHAAKALGISRRALYRLISRYGLEDAGPPEAARPGSHD